MKNIKNLIGLLLMAAIIGFTSCSEDDDDDAIGPALDVNVIGETTVTPSSTVVVTWEARDGDAKLDYFTILEGNTAVQGWNQKEIPNDLNETYNDTAYLQAPATDGNSTTFTFTVTDKDGLEKSVSKTITAEAQSADIDTYSSVTIVSAYLAATAGSQFMDATTGTTYRHDATGSENATFGFISGGGSGAVIMASGTSLSFVQQPAGWSNAAKLATTSITGSEFDAISDETALLAAMPASINSDEIKNLQDGAANASITVIAFDDNGTKGLIKLPASLNNNQDQSITIDVKVQQ